MKKVKIGSRELVLIRGDISRQKQDILVNAANNHFWMGSGVAGALKRQGGEEIEREAMAKGPVEPGECIVTGPGKLDCRHVIHAAVMGQDLKTDEQILTRAMTNIMKTAGDLKAETLAIPALGTGVGHFSIYDAARIQLQTAMDAMLGNTSLKTVSFILFDEEVFDAFSQRLDRLFHRS